MFSTLTPQSSQAYKQPWNAVLHHWCAPLVKLVMLSYCMSASTHTKIPACCHRRHQPQSMQRSTQSHTVSCTQCVKQCCMLLWANDVVACTGHETTVSPETNKRNVVVLQAWGDSCTSMPWCDAEIQTTASRVSSSLVRPHQLMLTPTRSRPARCCPLQTWGLKVNFTRYPAK